MSQQLSAAMRNLAIYLAAVATLHPTLAARYGAHFRDLLAFPKYEVQFLNDLPIAAADAARLQELGLDQEHEYMGLHPATGQDRRVGDGSESSARNRLDLLPMSLLLPDSDETGDFLCLLPSRNTTESQVKRIAEIDDRPEEEVDPVEGWKALSHLDGRCLFSKQGWFTYAYCHNSHIRQFRELPHAHPHPPGGIVPEEDTSYDGYTLGVAAPPRARSSLPPGQLKEPQTGPDTSIDRANSPSHASHSTQSQRYLVQHWSDGTVCDKSGRPRETEVQIHCSSSTNDMIYMIKEQATCQYVLIIHTPHVCSLPGFRPEHVDVEPAAIRCRQILTDEEFLAWEEEKQREERGEHLGLPWGSRPAGVPQIPLELPHMDPKVQEEAKGWSIQKPEGILTGIDNAELRAMLLRALEGLADGAGAARVAGQAGGDLAGGMPDAEGGEEVMLVSWEEDENGDPLFFDAEVLVGAGEGGAGERQGLNQQDRQVLLQMVREYLDGRAAKPGKGQDDDEEDNQRVNDEL